MSRTTESRKDEGAAAKRAQTELTASVGSRLVPQTSWLEAAVQRPSEDARRRRMIPQFAVRYSS